VLARLQSLGYTLELKESAKDFLAEKGYDPQFGARPLHRAIQKYLEDPLAEAILNNEFAEGAVIELEKSKDAEELLLKLKSKKTSKKKSGGNADETEEEAEAKESK
jgi:ATP-dependent Clp protease ATP-binding subunit ClpC